MKLYETSQINGMVLKNRFVRSATWEGMAGDDGSTTTQLIDCMETLARGGVGLIITSHAFVLENGRARPKQIGVYHDDLIPGLGQMTRAVHDRGGKIGIQLNHAGLFSDAALTHETPFGPSVVSRRVPSSHKEMTLDHMETVTEAFGQAARRAKAAGFDCLQIHAAHGYLLNQFLSPAFNKRKDRYGGGIENRWRMVADVLERIRKYVGTRYPVLVKMNSEDFLPGGLSREDTLRVAVLLEETGADAIELSGGTIISGKQIPSRPAISGRKDEAYYKDAAVAFKAAMDLPLILVGGIRSFQGAETMLKAQAADYISMSRPFIREPDLINRWRSGDFAPSTCISDNRCFEPAIAGKGIYCVMDKKLADNRSKNRLF
jgi:2,4-dienoyl-CoA reductase-like NADH-dependent reductase (Old Yellow Enzyme family)